MEEYKNFLKYTEVFLNKHADKLNIVFNEDESSVSISLAYHYWDTEKKDKQNKKIHKVVSKLNNNFYNNQSFQIYLDNRRMNNLTKAWFNNAKKLSITLTHFSKINQVCFSYMNIAETLEYLKEEEKEYAEIIIKNAKNKHKLISNYDTLNTLEQIKKFSFNEQKLDEILSHYLSENINENQSPKISSELFDFVRTQLSEKKWKDYLQYFPEKAYLINPKEEDKKDSLFVSQNSKLTLELDREFVAQKYTSLIIDSDVIQALDDFAKTIIQKNIKGLENIKSISTSKTTYFILGTNSDFVEEDFKMLVLNYLMIYAQNKEKINKLSDEFVSKTLDYLIMADNISCSELNRNRVKKNKI